MEEFLFIPRFVQSQAEYSWWVAKFGRNGEGGKNMATGNLDLGEFGRKYFP